MARAVSVSRRWLPPILYVLSCLGGTTLAAIAQDPLADSWRKYMYSKDDAEWAKARTEILKDFSLEMAVAFLKDHARYAHANLQFQDTKTEADSVAAKLRGYLSETTKLARAQVIALACGRGRIPDEDFGLLVRSVRLGYEVYRAVSILCDIREPGTPVTFERNSKTHGFVQACGNEMNELGSAMLVLAALRNDAALEGLAYEMWNRGHETANWDKRYPNQDLAELPFKEGASPDERKRAIARYVEHLQYDSYFVAPGAPPRVPPEMLPPPGRALTNEQMARREKVLAELRPIIDRWNEAEAKGDTAAAARLLAPTCAEREKYLGWVKEHNITVVPSEEARFGLEKLGDADAVVVLRDCKVSRTEVGKEPETFLSRRVYGFILSDGRWLLVSIRR